MGISIRQARSEDIPSIVDLINGFAAQDLMLPRTPQSVEAALDDWLVALAEEEDKPAKLAGCGALAALTPDLAEIRSLAVNPDVQGAGVGSRLVVDLIAEARTRDFARVCALTLREGFFQRLGFTVVDRWSISPKLWQECIYCPKFHRCDEVAVLFDLSGAAIEESKADPSATPAWTPLLKWEAWQPLKLAYHKKPIQIEE